MTEPAAAPIAAAEAELAALFADPPTVEVGRRRISCPALSIRNMARAVPVVRAMKRRLAAEGLELDFSAHSELDVVLLMYSCTEEAIALIAIICGEEKLFLESLRQDEFLRLFVVATKSQAPFIRASIPLLIEVATMAGALMAPEQAGST